MGFKRYLPWHDAIYGLTNYWTNNNNNIPQNSTVAANCLVWTVKYICLI